MMMGKSFDDTFLVNVQWLSIFLAITFHPTSKGLELLNKLCLLEIGYYRLLTDLWHFLWLKLLDRIFYDCICCFSSRGKKGFGSASKRVILFSNVSGEFGDDQLDDILASFKESNFELNVMYVLLFFIKLIRFFDRVFRFSIGSRVICRVWSWFLLVTIWWHL